MRTVALITTRFVRHGPTKQLLYLIRLINKEKIKPLVITLSPEHEPSLIDEFKSEDVEIIQLNLTTFRSIVVGRKIINKLIIERKIEIIHSFTYAMRVEYIICKLKGIYKIASIRNSPKNSSSGHSGILIKPIFSKLKLKWYKNFDLLVPCSNSINELSELRNFNKHTIQNGIDISIIKKYPIVTNKKRLKESLFLPTNKTVFITISNGKPIKNSKFLISYFEKREDSILIICGDLDHGIKIETLSSNIICLGHINNIYNYYRAADIFISASTIEGLPNAVLESLLMGTPCILSNIPMHAEVLANTNDAIGLLFKNNDSEDLTKKIKHLSSLINNKTGNNCSNYVIKYFSSLKTTQNFEKLYLSV